MALASMHHEFIYMAIRIAKSHYFSGNWVLTKLKMASLTHFHKEIYRIYDSDSTIKGFNYIPIISYFQNELQMNPKPKAAGVIKEATYKDGLTGCCDTDHHKILSRNAIGASAICGFRDLFETIHLEIWYNLFSILKLFPSI